jgi:hypothetical protein
MRIEIAFAVEIVKETLRTMIDRYRDPGRIRLWAAGGAGSPWC